MPRLPCPFNGCSHATEDESENLAIALFNAHVSTHTVTTANNVQRVGPSKSEKIARPRLSQGMPEEGWNSFIVQWKIYKSSAALTEDEGKLQLIYCCEQDLLEHVLRSDPDITGKAEPDQLASIRRLCVIPVAMGVRRSDVLNLAQDSAELARSFLSRIQGKAATCNFVTSCNAVCCKNNPPKVDFSDVVIKYVLVNGLADAEIRRDVLGWKDLDTSSVADTIAFVENKEMARDAYKGELSAVKTQYVKQQQDPRLKMKAKCESCDVQVNPFVLLKSGKISSERKFCAKCWKAKGVKSFGTDKKKAEDTGEGAALFHGIAMINNKRIETTRYKGRKAIVLSHHIFDSANGWRQRSADKQPMLKVRIEPCRDMYEELEISYPSVKGSVIEGIADTGAQSCLWGLSQFYKCGFKKHQLIPVKQRMQAANRECIDIRGALFLTVKASDQVTHVMVYVSPDVQGMYFSKQCLKELGVISEKFPCAGEMSNISAVGQYTPDNLSHSGSGTGENVGQVCANSTAVCGCLLRQSPPTRPSQLPFSCTAENIDRMKKWLIDRYAASTFNKCTHQPLPFIKAEPMKLHTDENVMPVAHHTPAIVPLHFRDKVKEGLDADERLGVIERVPEGVPTTWLHRMVIMPKENGDPRRTVDLSPLNKHCARETHATTPPFQQARLVPAKTWKSVTDAWSRFHSALIKEEDRHKTSFITEWGRYRYRVAPQGYVSSTDGYSRRYDKIIEKVVRKTKITDDTALWDDELEEHWWRIIDYLQLVGTHGIILNSEKFQFCKRSIDFAGFRISEHKVEPLPKYLQAITTFPKPEKLQDIRSWFGLVNQVAHYNKLIDIMAPFRPLLSSKAAFYWSDELQDAFEKSKEMIVEAIRQGVEIFELSRPTKLQTDYSTSGIGYYLSQKHCDCDVIDPDCCSSGWRITLAGSRFLKSSETRYAAIEGECLGVQWALEQTRYFTLGCDPLIVVVDHKPLVGFLNDKTLDDVANARLFKLKEKMMRWKFTVVYKPGKVNFFADFASRNPASSQDPELSVPEAGGLCDVAEEDVQDRALIATIATVFKKQLPIKAVTWDLVKSVTKNDEVVQQVIAMVFRGFPEYKFQMSAALQDYWVKRSDLYVVDGVLMCGRSVVIPKDLRPAILEVLGSAHQGVVAMKTRARDAVYWPGMGTDVEDFKKNCLTCRQIQPSQVHNTNFSPRIPSMPFESIVADYFDLAGQHYLVIADRLSGWTEVTHVVRNGASGSGTLCGALRRNFVLFGVPADCSTDGGPEFVSKAVKDLFQSWGVQHIVSSAYLAKSNGRAELAVKATKRLLRDNVNPNGSIDTDKFVRAMLTKRNTPDSYSRLSPAEIVLGRKLSDALPVLPKDKIFTHNEGVDSRWRDMWRKREEAMRDTFNRNLEKISSPARSLKPLAVGQYVIIQNQHGPHPLRWDRTGLVVECKPYDQYVVKVHGSNRLTLRNRRFLRSYDPPAGVDRQVVMTPHFAETGLNRGAGSQEQPVRDVQVSGPVQEQLEGHIDDDNRDQMSEGHENTDIVTEPYVVPLAPNRPDVQGSKRSVRCSSRSNKGKTEKYGDFVTGKDIDKL